MGNRLSTLAHTIKEQLKGEPRGKGLVIPSMAPISSASPIDPATKLAIWDSDESFALATQFVAESAVGAGHSVQITPDDGAAKEIQRNLTRFAEDIDLDSIAFEQAENLAGWGYGFTERISPNDLVHLRNLPVWSRWNLITDQHTQQVVKIEQWLGGNSRTFVPNDLIFWRYRPRGRILPTGILDLAATSKEYRMKFADDTTKTYTVPSLYERKGMGENDMRLVYHNQIPRPIIQVEDASDDDLTTIRKDISQLEAGERYVINKQVKMVQEMIDARANFAAYLDDVDTKIVRATGTPMLKLFTSRGFTEASARVVAEQFDRKIESLRRNMKRTIEREIYRVRVRHQFSDDVANRYEIRLRWNELAKPTINEQNIVAFVTSNVMTKDEARATLRSWGYQHIAQTTPPELLQPTQTKEREPNEQK